MVNFHFKKMFRVGKDTWEIYEESRDNTWYALNHYKNISVWGSSYDELIQKIKSK